MSGVTSEQHVRDGYILFECGVPEDVQHHETLGREFDAWLRSVKADAWDEGEAAGRANGNGVDEWESPIIRNPYRSSDGVDRE